jgi:hypothetical protein
MQSQVKLSDYIIGVTQTNRAGDLSTLTSRLRIHPPTFAPPVTLSLTNTLAPLGIIYTKLVPSGTITTTLALLRISTSYTPLGVTTTIPILRVPSHAPVRMSYSAYKYQRRESLLMSVAEQNAILSSDTPTARTQAGSSAVNPWYYSIGADGSWDEEYKYTDLMAMVVLEDVPHEV